MLVVFLLLSLTTFSQNGTNNEPQVCMPLTKARQVAQDLLRLDSLQAEHNKTLFVLERTNSKIEIKDSIINANTEKIDKYLKEIGTHEEKFKTSSERITKLETEVTDLQTKNTRLRGWIQGLGGGLIATLTTLISVIAIK
jgi:chromosome segregation ATPase